jgi:hypothetical protein
MTQEALLDRVVMSEVAMAGGSAVLVCVAETAPMSGIQPCVDATAVPISSTTTAAFVWMPIPVIEARFAPPVEEENAHTPKNWLEGTENAP